jgi:hypothetical protein
MCWSRADERLAHAFEQSALADEQLARVTEQLLDRDAARQTSRGGPALRGLIRLLLAACIFGAAFVSHSSYGGDAAKLIIARWAPQLIPTPSGSPEKPGLPAQPSPPTAQLAAAKETLGLTFGPDPASAAPASRSACCPTSDFDLGFVLPQGSLTKLN